LNIIALLGLGIWCVAAVGVVGIWALRLRRCGGPLGGVNMGFALVRLGNLASRFGLRVLLILGAETFVLFWRTV
jgi:hypothetical protein